MKFTASVWMAVLLAIIDILSGLPPTTCNYVYTDTEPLAMDVCRTVVTDGTNSYRKYVCNGTTVLDETYNGENCTGDATEEIASGVTASACENEGTCTYLMIESPCRITTNTFTIQAIIANTCIEIENGQRSYIWDNSLDPPKYRYYYNQICGGSPDDKTIEFECTNYDGIPLSAAKYFKTRVYGPTISPTKEPTDEPTMKTGEPTANPTMMPTEIPSSDPTVNPTLEPTAEPTTSDPTTVKPTTAYPTNPTTATPTTANPTTNAPTNDGKTDESSVYRIHIIANTIFVTFMVIFMPPAVL